VIAVGETQERLTWVVPPSFTPELLAIYNEEFSLPLVARGAQAAVIGTVTAEKTYVLRSGGDDVMNVDIEFLTGGIRYDRPHVVPDPLADHPVTNQAQMNAVDSARPQEAAPSDARSWTVGALLHRVLAHPDVCSRRAIFERFDSVVRGTTAVPCGYADAGLIVPVPGAPLAAALAVDGNPRYALVDVRRAAELAVCEAVRNVAAVGATPAALTDCLNFGNPEIPEQMGQFVAAVDGIAHAARELGVPFVSGNVSLYNTSANGSAIPASPIVACVGTCADVSRTATHRFKGAGHALFFVGLVQSAAGGSVYASVRGIDDTLPQANYEHARRELRVLAAGFERGLIAAAHDVSDGGLLVAVAEMAFANLDLDGAPAIGARLRDTSVWANGSASQLEDYFGEYGGFVVEAFDATAFAELGAEFDANIAGIGETISDAALVLEADGGERLELRALHESWSAPLRDFYGDVPA
jgi:phosphoribosylformylglycinamidine synthase